MNRFIDYLKIGPVFSYFLRVFRKPDPNHPTNVILRLYRSPLRPMNTETLRDYCLTRTGATESFPFGEETLVFKVGGKIFALMDTESRPTTINLKCDPERAVQLREQFSAVVPGYHMNKTHWNTVTLDGSIRNSDVQDWIDHSYELVRKSLPKAIREQLN
jgi:predicted DNA-binding protein (MmcQ/YjbR family)